MRFLLAIWTIVMFILTCTNDVYRLREGEIAFSINLNPHWSDLFTLYPLSEVSRVEFIGHFFMFFILTAILIGVFNRIVGAVVVSSLYALGTELLQPFFSRGAEGVDLLADMVGVAAFIILYGVVKIGFIMGRKRASTQDKRMRDVM